MWASQFAAFESLSNRTREYLTGLTAHHCAPGRPETSADHPLVCRHPRTGRRALFFNELFTVRVNELPPDESDAVLTLLAKRCVQPEHTCRWRWRPGDIAIWDNHFVQHYALGDYHPASRRIHRIEICGQPPIPAT
jgi:taurine dioxygenase